MQRTKKRGSFLIELMIVVAVIAFLSVLAIPNLMRFFARARRAEVYMNLSSLYAAEKAYWIENGCYSAKLLGERSVGWKPEGYCGGGQKEKFYYTYGFSGQEGQNYFSGKLNSIPAAFAKAFAGKEKFIALAVGDVNGDGKLDVIAVDENNNITILEDALS